MGRVCVTGASGFIASHIVEQLLANGHTVHGTVRDAANTPKTAHLLALPGAADRLKLFSADLTGTSKAFAAAFDGCDGVIHTATPVILDAEDPEKSVYAPALAGLESVLEAIDAVESVTTVVLTSSMAAVAPKPDPPVKSEVHWSDADAQIAKNYWYGAAKTRQELRATAWASKAAQENRARPIRFVAICPTLVLGPMLQPGVNSTMQFLADVVTGAKGKMETQAPNDSMSFVDVRDTAAMHVAAYERADVEGRYIAVVASLHWNDIFRKLKPLAPGMRDVAPCDGDPSAPTTFDHSRMHTLIDPAKLRSVDTILADAVRELRDKGELKGL